MSSHLTRQPDARMSPFQRVYTSHPILAPLLPVGGLHPHSYRTPKGTFQPPIGAEQTCLLPSLFPGERASVYPRVCQLWVLRLGRSEEGRFLLPLPPPPAPRVLWREWPLLAVGKSQARERDAQLSSTSPGPLSAPQQQRTGPAPPPPGPSLTSLYVSTFQKQCPLWERCWGPRAVTSFDECQC